MANVKSLLVTAALLAISPQASAQGAIGLVGFGYSVPPAGITAAPGQILMFTVTGLESRIPAPIRHNGEPYPLELQGISVALVQGGRETMAPLFGIQQQDCATPNCAVQTSITVQMPYELETTGSAAAYLMIREHGSVSGSVPIVPVRDSIRMIQDCDLAFTLVNPLLSPTLPCSARVLNVTGNMDGRGPFVSLQHAPKGGDHLLAGAFGLGAVQGAVTGKRLFNLPVPPNMFQISVEFATNARPRRMVPNAGIEPIAPYYIGLSDVGVYQIDFPAPALPFGTALCDGKNIISNATITVAGPSSFDGIQLCIQ